MIDIQAAVHSLSVAIRCYDMFFCVEIGVTAMLREAGSSLHKGALWLLFTKAVSEVP